MRTLDYLLDIEDVCKLLLYLYMFEDRTITYNNGIADLKIRMDDNFNIKCTNLNFPDLPEMSFNEQMTVPYMMGIVDILKEQEPKDYPDASFKSRWDEITTEIGTIKALNMDQLKRIRMEREQGLRCND